MKKTKQKSLKFSKVSVAKISQLETKLVFGGTDPVSFLTDQSARASHCNPLICY